MTLRYNYITLPTLRGGAITRCTVQIRPTVWHKYVLALVNSVLFFDKIYPVVYTQLATPLVVQYHTE